MKKLVELDPVSMTTLEFDLKKIKRSAEALKHYLLQLDPTQDRYWMKELILPIVEQALQGTMTLPFDGNKEPLRYESVEGLLPNEYFLLKSQ